jgi:hypothetical protein
MLQVAFAICSSLWALACVPAFHYSVLFLMVGDDVLVTILSWMVTVWITTHDEVMMKIMYENIRITVNE